MTNEQINQITEVIRLIVHGPVTGAGAQPMGLEALTMALSGRGQLGEDSVAAGLHDIASAIRELAEAIQNRQ